MPPFAFPKNSVQRIEKLRAKVQRIRAKAKKRRSVGGARKSWWAPAQQAVLSPPFRPRAGAPAGFPNLLTSPPWSLLLLMGQSPAGYGASQKGLRKEARGAISKRKTLMARTNERRRALAALLLMVHSATMSAGSASTLALVPVCSTRLHPFLRRPFRGASAPPGSPSRRAPRKGDVYICVSRLSFEPPRGQGQVEDGVRQLREWARACGDERILIISGAGLSTASGIPDYRSPQGSYSKGHKPMQHDEFLLLEGQQRYWSRSMVGWRAFNTAQACLS
jgi:hypothetical protein